MRKSITVDELKQFPAFKKFYVYDGDQKRRAEREDDDSVFIYGKGRKRYGTRWNNLERFVAQYEVDFRTEDDENETWHKRIDRAIKCLKTSGLSPNILEHFQNLRKMTLKDKREMNEIYWCPGINCSYNDRPKYRMQEYQDKGYVDKYPFAFYEAEDGTKDIHFDFISEISDCKLKSMYFGKYRNAKEKERIKEAMENKKDYSVRTRTSYDVTFDYDASKNAAWYNEEYKDCGNGHYYLALDHSTALFLEND